jgi:hypothetical protein
LPHTTHTQKNKLTGTITVATDPSAKPIEFHRQHPHLQGGSSSPTTHSFNYKMQTAQPQSNGTPSQSAPTGGGGGQQPPPPPFVLPVNLTRDQVQSMVQVCVLLR